NNYAAAVTMLNMFRNLAVLDRTDPDVAARASELVRKLFAKRGIERSIERDDDLTENGLSSLEMVNLMLAVEAEFDIKIPDRDMTPTNFRSVARIEALVDRLLAQAA